MYTINSSWVVLVVVESFRSSTLSSLTHILLSLPSPSEEFIKNRKTDYQFHNEEQNILYSSA